MVRAVLLANAIATNIRGLRSNICSSHDPLGGPFLIAPSDPGHGADDQQSSDVALPHL